jgi:hypothetical protein
MAFVTTDKQHKLSKNDSYATKKKYKFKKWLKAQRIDFITTVLPIMLRALNSVAQAPISRYLRKKYL